MLLSITIMTLWIIGFFILKLPMAVHLLLALSILIYIRSLLHISSSVTQKYYRTEKSSR
jgi:multisubunit Na+/H+ antiporter MnhC subunit